MGFILQQQAKKKYLQFLSYYSTPCEAANPGSRSVFPWQIGTYGL